jgi:hypothetical protein
MKITADVPVQEGTKYPPDNRKKQEYTPLKLASICYLKGRRIEIPQSLRAAKRTILH